MTDIGLTWRAIMSSTRSR